MSPACCSIKPRQSLHHIVGAAGQGAARRQMAHEIARRRGERRIRSLGDLGIALPLGLVADPRVDVAGGAGHGARAHRLAARRLHRLVDLARHLALRQVAGRQGIVVVAAAQREGIGRAAGEHHLVARHPAADLRQPHPLAVHPRGIDREGHRHLGIAGERLRRLGEGLLEGIGGVVAGLAHGFR